MALFFFWRIAMKTIKFVSTCGQQDVAFPSVGIEFKNGQEILVSDEQAAVLLTNPQCSIVDAAPKQIDSPAKPQAIEPPAKPTPAKPTSASASD
jgi:hypothetical protein